VALPEPEFWLWQGHRIACIRQGSPDSPAAVVLIHGFGASLGHWRHNLPALAQQVEVYALDLLGFGASDKPRSRLDREPERADSVRYCFDLWAEQVRDFVAEGLPPERPLHLVGNSIGGLVALNTARLLEKDGRPPAQVVLIDCAQRTLDEKRIAELPIWEQAGRPMVKQLVRQRWLLAALFTVLARPGFIRRVLRIAYPSGANVDDQLVALLHRPATDPGAVESFRGFVNLFRDHLAPDLLAELRLPVRMVWGGLDPWEAPAEARRWAATYPCVRELRVLDGLGHCPHDEAPERVNPILLEWLVPKDDSPC
jgi:pimeloyl-ACP methyl ester carboxylesterase